MAKSGSSKDNYYVDLVEPATEEEIEEIAEDLKLGVSEDELEEYRDWVNKILKRCTKMQGIEEETIPVLYPRIPGVRPPAKSNIYNAWASMVHIKGAENGLLAGKRIAVKDNIFLAGTPLQNGSKVWDGYTPEFDATVVTRILQAGGTILGKSTCENQCFSGSSYTSISGPVRNPRDVTRSSGGSSSGSAVLIATGEVDMALGGDQGGSVRLPACWTGCVGLKPTFGLVPVTGSIGMMPAIDHIGPMAANVRDVALLLEVIAGYDDGRDHRQRPDLTIPQYSKMLNGNLSSMKFGYVKEGLNRATEGVKSAIDRMLDKMRAAGATVDDVSIPLHADGTVVITALLGAYYDNMIRNNGQASGYNEFYQVSAAKHISKSLKAQAHDLQPTVKAVTFLGEYLRRKDGSSGLYSNQLKFVLFDPGGQIAGKAMNMRSTIRKEYDAKLQTYDALLMPTIPFVAPKLPKQDMSVEEFIRAGNNVLQNTQMFNLTGHPSVSMTVGLAKPEDDKNVELPVGLMITGKHFEDARVLDIAYGLENLLDEK